MTVLPAAIAVAGFGVYKHVFSEVAPSVDWISTQPTITRTTELSSAPTYDDLYSNRDCTRTNVLVYRNLTSAPTETHCLVPTAMGLMEHEGAVIQPVGYSKAYPITKYFNNFPLIPVPNEGAAIQMSPYPTGAGVTLDLYKNLYSHAQLGVVNGGQQFKLIDPAEEHFKYGDGTLFRFNFASFSFAHNGRYFIVDTVTNGFMKVDLLNLGRQPIATSLPRDSSGGLLAAATAIDDSGKFAAIAYGAPGGYGDPYFKIMNTEACTGSFNSSSSTPPTFSCPTVDLRAQLAAVIPNLFEIKNVRFVNDRTISFVASTSTPTGRKYARYSMTAGGQRVSLEDYLAIGDSYISGEGAFSYREGTDTERNRCHQSTLSYPYILGTLQSSFKSVACSGALSYNIAPPLPQDKHVYQVYGGDPSGLEIDTAKAEHIPGFVLQNAFASNDNPTAITVSIGGNDIGFGDIITQCVHPFQNLKDNLVTHHTCFSTYEDRLELVNHINEQMAKLNQLYQDLRNNGAGSRRVYVIGYPQVAKVGGDCGLNVQMNADEVVFAHDLIEYLDSVIKKAADAAGVVYVDTEHAFDGQRLCEGDGANSAMNGFTIGKTSWGAVGFAESFHPNKTGHQKLADTIAAQTSNLTKAMPEPTTLQPITSVDQNMPLLKNAPKTNRAVRHVQALGQDAAIVLKGATMVMNANAASYFLKPNTVYQMVLHSDPITIGNVTSDGQGNIAAAPVIPASAEPGFHSMHLYGNDIFGNPIDLKQGLYVAASANDYDSDGVDNGVDSCMLAAQSGIDKDVDNIDDVCDPLVTAPPTTPPIEEGIVWRDDSVLEIEIQGVSGQ